MKPPAPIDPALERTDYRSLVQKEHLGQWDLMKPDGTYRDAVVQIDTLRLYVPRKRKRTKVGTDKGGKPIYEEEALKRIRITFVGKRKAWLAGPVSLATIAKLYGPIVQDWIGQRVILFVDPKVEFGGKITGGIRVRPRLPGATADLEDDPLDNAVDAAKAAELEAAAATENEWAEEGGEP
jgi:hypothetical protein